MRVSLTTRWWLRWRVKVPAEFKSDSEYRLTSPGPRARKEELLRRGLSDIYVHLCFEAYEQEIITAGRLAEMLLVGPQEVQATASLYNGGRSSMGFDPSRFHPFNVTDTCAVWNTLSSRVLYSTARARRLSLLLHCICVLRVPSHSKDDHKRGP